MELRLFCCDLAPENGPDIHGLLDCLEVDNKLSVSFEMIDVLKDSDAALNFEIFVTPTLLLTIGSETKYLIGNLENKDQLCEQIVSFYNEAKRK